MFKKWMLVSVLIFSVLGCSLDTYPDYASVKITKIESINEDKGLKVSFEVSGQDIAYVVVNWGRHYEFLPPETTCYKAENVGIFDDFYLTVVNSKGESSFDTAASFTTKIKYFFPVVRGLDTLPDSSGYLYWDEGSKDFRVSYTQPSGNYVVMKWYASKSFKLYPRGLRIAKISDTVTLPYRGNMGYDTVNVQAGSNYYIAVYDPDIEQYYLLKIYGNKIWYSGLDFVIGKFADERVKNLRKFGK